MFMAWLIVLLAKYALKVENTLGPKGVLQM